MSQALAVELLSSASNRVPAFVCFDPSLKNAKIDAYFCYKPWSFQLNPRCGLALVSLVPECLCPSFSRTLPSAKVASSTLHACLIQLSSFASDSRRAWLGGSTCSRFYAPLGAVLRRCAFIVVTHDGKPTVARPLLPWLVTRPSVRGPTSLCGSAMPMMSLRQSATCLPVAYPFTTVACMIMIFRGICTVLMRIRI